MNLLAELRNPDTRRSKSAHKLAARVVENPEAIISMSTASLAALAEVSEPTVNRFCTGLGLKGFPDFKLALAAELARSQPRIAQAIESGDSSGAIISKIFETTHASLTEVQQQLDPADIENTVALLDGARSICLAGLGASASVALDAQHKLLRFPTPVIAHTDIINQRVMVTGLGPEDCLVCISYTGRTRAMVDLARLGREQEARVIGITTPGSPLARHCEQVLGVQCTEDTELYTPMTSRLAQLVIVDILATSLALRKGDEFSSHLQQVKRNLNDTRNGK